MPYNITSENDLISWLKLTFPLFTNSDLAKVLLYYPSQNGTTDTSAGDYATSGYTGATALNVSAVGTGQQQRANVRRFSSCISFADFETEHLCRDNFRLSIVLDDASV